MSEALQFMRLAWSAYWNARKTGNPCDVRADCFRRGNLRMRVHGRLDSEGEAMKNWIKRNCGEIAQGIFAIVLLSALVWLESVIWLADFPPTAHAQKPELSYSASGSEKPEFTLRLEPYEEKLIGEYIKKHCVVVLTEKHDAKTPVVSRNDITPEIKDGYFIEHVPEQTRPLRCK